MIQNQVLGKGKIRLRARDRNNLANYVGGERYIGNTPEFNLAVESETLDHFDSDNGIRVKDKSVTLEVNRTGSFITDNINPENLAMFFLGTTAVNSQSSGTVSAEAHTVSPGYHYRLGTGTDPMGVRNVTAVTVTGTGGTPSYAVDTDYLLDAVNGKIEILEGGAISADTPIEVNYTTAAETRNRVISGSDDFVGELFFECTNPEGKRVDVLMPYVKISPNGDFALNSEEWQQLGFNLEVLKLSDTTDSIIMEDRG